MIKKLTLFPKQELYNVVKNAGWAYSRKTWKLTPIFWMNKWINQTINQVLSFRKLKQAKRLHPHRIIYVTVLFACIQVDLEQTQRMVETREGEALAEKFGCPFYETSAAHRRHVDDVFHTLVREIRYINNLQYLCCFESDFFNDDFSVIFTVQSS